MAVEIFTADEFESALPVHKETGEQLWESAGIIQGEYTYRIFISPAVFIQIRSSIKENGFSADTGKDSIRAWLTDTDGAPLGSKVQSWVTRTRGWEIRMVEMLRELWGRAKKAGYCPKCKRPRSVFKVKKNGANKGRLFCKCVNCNNNFEWLT